MKKLSLLIILITISLQGFSQITFTALVTHFKEDGEKIQTHLVENGFTFINKNSAKETYAYGYISKTKAAKVWVEIFRGIVKIEILSYNDSIHNNLKNEIIQYCEFKGTEKNNYTSSSYDHYVYKNEVTFYISSIGGANVISILKKY